MKSLKISHSLPFRGELEVPGDKSISHRAVILAALSKGTSKIQHFLKAEDCLNTLKALNALGVVSHWSADGDLLIEGMADKPFVAPTQSLDFGNSGTGLRLMAGILVAQPFDSILTGDASLCARPMDRIIDPLKKMGAQISGVSLDGKTVPPLEIKGGQSLHGIEYDLPVASAQVKSCLLLASRFAKGSTHIQENKGTRDHTERLLKKFQDKGQGPLHACELRVPGDISSAAFFMVAATLIPGSHLKLKAVGLNPTRMGVIHILKLMGADIQIEYQNQEWEPIADITVKYSPLSGILIPESEVVSAIDEFPILFIAAAFAKGKTVLRNATELRVKETDRLSTMAENLLKLGVTLKQYSDGIEIEGLCIPQIPIKALVDSKGDHRIAMAFCIAACVLKNQNAANELSIQDTDCIKTSFPNFIESLGLLGTHFQYYSLRM